MSLEPGQIIGTDLSANANILGTQIADKTLQFRNFSDDAFKIVQSGFITSPSLSVSDPGAGNYSSTSGITILAHNLGFYPAILGFVAQPGQPYQPMPSTSVGGGSGTSTRWFTMTLEVDNANIYYRIDVTVAHQAFSLNTGDFIAKYYLLEETLNT